ncbi:hypothetical protein KUL42_13380 [Alteromonas sp. KUL42]|uniref:hypothetical protein n=1 Tax=Alteromonas sp. KUL42 TaxID=2480797 RepID=UPI00103560AB|nr:hypothetical protein [Alteromonas sp. KUL42]TAP37154.1 hypothetical protein EYR97_06610 [Alteromonas sp. KUL42]GEA06577.1 hypothetical protein KUL42_13380 [Alteromonas sp. KUL42]
MLSKILKTTALVALEVLLDDPSEEAKKQDKFIDEHNDGAGNVNFFGDDYSEQEAREAHDRGEFYY